MARDGWGHDQSAPWGGKKVGKHPTDRGKIGTKRSVLTEGGGVPVGLAVEGANRHDFKMARETIASIPIARPEPTPDTPQGMCLDKGYDDDEGRDLLTEFGLSVTILCRITRRASIAPWACTAAGDHRGEFSPGGHGTASRYGDHCRGSS